MWPASRACCIICTDACPALEHAGNLLLSLAVDPTSAGPPTAPMSISHLGRNDLQPGLETYTDPNARWRSALAQRNSPARCLHHIASMSLCTHRPWDTCENTHQHAKLVQAPLAPQPSAPQPPAFTAQPSGSYGALSQQYGQQHPPTPPQGGPGNPFQLPQQPPQLQVGFLDSPSSA